MKEVLEKSLFEVPYNSYGKIILSAGEQYPDSYGGNCVFQCRRITSGLVESLIDKWNISYITASEKPHWVVLVDDGDEYLLDPFLLCPEPINITRVLSWERITLDAYPKGNNKIEVKLIGEKTIQIHLFIRKWTGFKQVLEYTYDLNKPKSDVLPPDDYQLLANLCQKNLEMWILMSQEREGEVIRIYRVPGQGNMDLRVIGWKHYTATKDKQWFDEYKSKIIARLWSTEDEFDRTWNLWERLYLERQVDICRLREVSQH